MINQMRHIALMICCSTLVVSITTYADADTHPQNIEQRLSDLTGTYYLQGVMEVGSAFRLQPNGEFQYMLTYGAVDKEANGTWQKTVTGVTLTSQSKPSIEKTKVNASQAWDEQAEEAWLEKLYDDNEKVIQKRCSILYPHGTTSSPNWQTNKPELSLVQLRALDADIIRMDAQFAATLQQLHALQARTLATKNKPEQERLAKKVRALYTKQVTQDRKLRDAYGDFNDALYQGENSTYFKKRDVNTIPRYKQPAVCINRLSTGASENPTDWQGGKKGNVVAVIVYSGEAYDKYRTISRVPLRFVFSDGSEKKVFLSGGYAVSKKPEGAELKRVVLLGLEDPQKGTDGTTVNITNDKPVQEIRLALTPPQAFDEMSFMRLDEDTLSPTHGNLKGKKYVRQ